MTNLYYEELKGRRLWADGESTLDLEGIGDLILSDSEYELQNVVTHVDNAELKKFSKLTGIKIKEKTSVDYSKLDDTFQMPTKYFALDLEKLFLKRVLKEKKDKALDSKSVEERVERVYEELAMFSAQGLDDILRLALYIVDTFEEQNIVWGPGRGSSCCSYLLYLTGLHDVDSVFFSLPIDEFLRN